MSAADVLIPPDKAPALADALPVASPTPPNPPPTPFDVHALVEPEFWDQIPPDVFELLTLLPQADLYVQDEVDVRHHPTLSRVWSKRGHRGQRLVRAPGRNVRAVDFVAVDWRDGWCSYGLALGRTADVFAQQLDHLVERSSQRGRVALVLADNAKIHTPKGAKAVRTALDKHAGRLHLVYTPSYDPSANPAERLFPPFRHAVTHNHHRANVLDLFADAGRYFQDLDAHPERVLRHLGSPFALRKETECPVA